MTRHINKPDGTLRSRDGRQIGYGEFGDPDGKAVILFHGYGDSRLTRHPEDELTARLGVRLVTIDRPGIGLTDPMKEHTIIDRLRDVEEVTEALKIDRFAVLGWSGGAPFALAAASEFGHHVTRVGIASGFGPFERPGFRNLAPKEIRRVIVILKAAPWMAGMLAKESAKQLQASGGAYMSNGDGLASSSDAALLANPQIRDNVTRGAEEAFRQGHEGVAADMLLVFRFKWGFKPEEVSRPVDLWYGEEDRMTPIEVGRGLASLLPDARLRVSPGAGHLLHLRYWEEILQTLIEARPAEVRVAAPWVEPVVVAPVAVPAAASTPASVELVAAEAAPEAARAETEPAEAEPVPATAAAMSVSEAAATVETQERELASAATATPVRREYAINVPRREAPPFVVKPLPPAHGGDERARLRAAGFLIDDEPEAVAAEPEAVVAEPEAVAAEPEAVAAEPEAVVAEPEAVAAPKKPARRKPTRSRRKAVPAEPPEAGPVDVEPAAADAAHVEPAALPAVAPSPKSGEFERLRAAGFLVDDEAAAYLASALGGLSTDQSGTPGDGAAETGTPEPDVESGAPEEPVAPFDPGTADAEDEAGRVAAELATSDVSAPEDAAAVEAPAEPEPAVTREGAGAHPHSAAIDAAERLRAAGYAVVDLEVVDTEEEERVSAPPRVHEPEQRAMEVEQPAAPDAVLDADAAAAEVEAGEAPGPPDDRAVEAAAVDEVTEDQRRADALADRLDAFADRYAGGAVETDEDAVEPEAHTSDTPAADSEPVAAQADEGEPTAEHPDESEVMADEVDDREPVAAGHVAAGQGERNGASSEAAAAAEGSNGDAPPEPDPLLERLRAAGFAVLDPVSPSGR